MGEQLKFIVERLNEAPYNKNLNLISFDSLQPIQLLQILNDVMTEINPQQASDLRDEEPEARVVRMLNFLRVMKYKPKSDGGSVSAFRQGIVQGDKPIIYPIVQWLLQNCTELKKRAYLARFLVKLDIPMDIQQDGEVSETHNVYLDLIQQFKDLHKESEQLKESGISASEIKKDITSMEEEKDQLIKRTERAKKRVETIANKDKLIQAAQSLRREREKETNTLEQRQTQKNQLNYAEQKMKRMHTQLKDLQVAGLGINAEDLLKRIEEENQVNTFLTQEKLPKEAESRSAYLCTLQKVADEPAMGQTELDVLNNQMKDMSLEINKLVEERMVGNDPMDDKLSVFRQQAAVIANKKNSAAESLQEAMDEFNGAENELKERKGQLKGSDDVQMLKGEEFKRYVNKLRGKSTVYKKKRMELSELQAEVGVLSRTEELLKSQEQQAQAYLSNLEAAHGVSGFNAAQEEMEKVSTLKSELDEQKGKTLEEMSQLVVQLTNSIAEKKSSLAPIIKELRPLRQECQELTATYEEKKTVYETTAAGLDSNMSKLEQGAKALCEAVAIEDSRYHYIAANIEILEVEQKRLENEIKSYVSSENNGKKSLRDQYTQKIHEQENAGKALKEEQKYIRENHAPNMRQMKMWGDLANLLQCKKELMMREGGAGAGTALRSATYEQEDHLVL